MKRGEWIKIAVVVCMMMGLLPVWQANRAEALSEGAWYVDAVQGNDDNPGTAELPFQTIEKARDAVRGMTAGMGADIHVYLRGGVFRLTDTVEFTAQDSGQNGYNVIYEAYPGESPVLSGDQTISGWELHDAAKNIYKAAAGADVETRQLYVDGIRAIRARSEGGLPDAAHDDNGLSTSAIELAGWGNQSDMEMVFKQMWTNPRGAVEAITLSDGKASIKMKQPGWYALRSKGSTSATVPWYYENAYELLDQPGEWYLDRTSDTFFYKPRPGEDLSTAQVSVPKLEKLVTMRGMEAEPVHNIQFRGIRFQYSTWLEPSSALGLPDVQSNVLRRKDPNSGITTESLTPAAVEITEGRSIVFERNRFSQLGSAAINMSGGSQNNRIIGNVFMDLSGSGIQIGEVDMRNPDHYNPLDPGKLEKGHTISNNFFYRIGVEYRSSVAIFADYPQNIEIAHNEISNMPYSGITLGWGWGDVDTSNRNNVIRNNYIHHTMQELVDGGSIYMLGTSYDITITGNYIKGQKNNFGAIYLDQGSSNITAENNVIEFAAIPIFINPSSNNKVRSTYTDSRKQVNMGTNSEISGTVYVPDGNWPAGAQAIIAAAGIESAYRDIIPTVPNSGELIRPQPPETTPSAPVDFAGKSSFVQSIVKAGKLRNEWGGWVGMKLETAGNPIAVTAFGRVNLPGSYGLHRMKLVDAATGADVSGSLVQLNMSDAAANGDFSYVQLPAAVTLEANKVYYLMSEEKVGEDVWYDSDMIVTTASVATARIGVWGSAYKESPPGGNSFVGLDFLYESGTPGTPAPILLPEPVTTQPQPEPDPLPVDLENTLGFVQSLSGGQPRSGWSGYAGMKFTIGSTSIMLTALGRKFEAGNFETHLLRLLDANTKALVTEAKVRPDGAQAGDFRYAQLYEPVRLFPGRSYYLVSKENYGGDSWISGSISASLPEIGSIDGPIYASDDKKPRVNNYLGDPLAGGGFAGLDFRYTTAQSGTTNLLNNGAFEYNTLGWTAMNATLSRVTVTADTYNNSAGSAKVTVTGNYGTPLQKVALEKNKTYEISVWVKLAVGSDVAQIILDHGTGTPRYGYVAKNTPVDTTWKQLKMNYTYTGSNDTADSSIQLRIGSGTTRLTYYFDDFEIKEAGSGNLNGEVEPSPSPGE
ncbi:Right handed beta helix region [Paenibacillaceae bacterium GAS479]|nr:Right handed beta helix region [Paenibacillaceae bacterium GAS479]